MTLSAVGDLTAAAVGLGSMAEVANEVLPGLTLATHATLVFVYHAKAPGQMVTYTPPGTPDLIGEYFRNYVADCPLHQIKERIDGAIIPTTRLAREKQFTKTAVYSDLFRPWGLDHHLVARLVPADAAKGTGEIGVIINRDRRRGEYTDDEVRMVEMLAPSLRAALRRASQLDDARARLTAVEALLIDSGDDRVKVVIDRSGDVVHVHGAGTSAAATAVVEALRDRAHPVNAAAQSAARSVGSVTLAHVVSAPTGETFRAELSRTAALLGGQPLVIATLVPLMTPAPRTWERWRLSRAETAILQELVAGRTNLEIGARLFISPETVRTHLTRVFKKMGVRSRLEAVIAATRR
jgi:DNA-binding CsgD family transcriptional regulator